MKKGQVTALQGLLGYSFSRPDLLVRALTHSSAAASGSSEEPRSYERLEFLGDRVLGLVIADMLDLRFPKAPEGELSRRLARLVSGEACADVAREMQLATYLRMGDSIRRSDSRATAGVLADVCESVLGAVYRDGGLEPARAIIERFWRDRLEEMVGPLRDAKTELQEWAHRRGFDTPAYLEVLRSGPDHAPQFEIEVTVGTIQPVRATGRSKREAEHEAAAILLRREGVWSAA
jgi:ribonuclease III